MKFGNGTTRPISGSLPVAGDQTAIRDLMARYARLSIAVVGDLFLDRYLEIDPARAERSLETGLTVHNVVSVRAEPGAAGAIVANLAAMGVGEVVPIGVVGEDGEGHELWNALSAIPNVRMAHVVRTGTRRTCAYVKPFVRQAPGQVQELERLDFKNWTPTPVAVIQRLAASVRAVAERAHAIVVMEQVEAEGTGVVTPMVLRAVADVGRARPELITIADSRRSLAGYPLPLALKMNAVEFDRLPGSTPGPKRFPGMPAGGDQTLDERVATFSAQRGTPVYVTDAEGGIVGATPGGKAARAPALPIRGPIDVVGAGDAVTAALAAALAARATPARACATAMVAASVVIHQIGSAGVASRQAMEALCGAS